MINPQWLELPMSRTNFHGPKDVRAIEVPLYSVKKYKYFSSKNKDMMGLVRTVQLTIFNIIADIRRECSSLI